MKKVIIVKSIYHQFTDNNSLQVWRLIFVGFFAYNSDYKVQ